MIKEYLECYKHIPYTIKHIIYFVKTEYKITKKIRFKSIFHDVDKIFMYIISPIFRLNVQKIQKIHRNISNHHAESGNDYLSMVIDWECARFTKPDKPLNAKETMEKYFINIKTYIEPILKKYNL